MGESQSSREKFTGPKVKEGLHVGCHRVHWEQFRDEAIRQQEEDIRIRSTTAIHASALLAAELGWCNKDSEVATTK